MRHCAARSFSPSSEGTEVNIDTEEGSDVEYTTDSTDVDDDISKDDCPSKEEMTASEDNLAMSDLEEDEDYPPEFYVAHAQEVNSSDIVETDYAPSSTQQLDRIEEQWRQFCTYVEKDPTKTFNEITIGDISSFLSWKLNQRRGKGGRRLQGTQVPTSLETYWKQFRLVYERATGRKINGVMNRQMHKVLKTMAKRLSGKKREKAPMDVVDVREVLQTALTTTDIRFKVGAYRILVCLFIIGMFISANRPGALLHLRYRHLLVTILRNPSGGPHRILLEFTYEFTKTYLGAKDPNTFPIPEIIFDPSLILSPHFFFLGWMFADGAFLAPNLKGPEDLSRLDIRPGCNSLPVPLDPEKADVYVFRQCIRTLNGWEMSGNGLKDSTIRPWIRKIGEIAGFLQVARPYCLRYGAGNAFDRNGNVSDALRNLMMQHAKTETFLKYYLSRRVTVDTQAIVRGLDPQDELMRAACRMSRWIDPERPWKLTPDQSSSVNDDPRVVKLVRRRAKLRGKASQVEEYNRLGREINNERQRLRHALRIKVREEWDEEQAVRDIEHQLSGLKFREEMKTTLASTNERTPEHNRLIECILSLPGSTIEEEVSRRNAAINAVIAYCKVEEGRVYPAKRQARSTGQSVSVKHEEDLECPAVVDPLDEALEAAKVSVYKEHRPRICFLCLGNEQLSVDQRTYSFSTSGDLSKHFKRKHLRYVKAGGTIACPLCMISLDHKMHLQNHALTVHGTVS